MGVHDEELQAEIERGEHRDMDVVNNLPVLPPRTPERQALCDLSALLLNLAAQADELASDGDLMSLAYGLSDLRRFRRQISDVEKHVEVLVADLMDRDILNLAADNVVLERRRGKDRHNWQSQSILDELFNASFVDADGVLRPTTAIDRFREAVRACVPLTGSLAWRTQALRSYGLDPDEYAETSPGRVSVKVSVKEDHDD